LLETGPNSGLKYVSTVPEIVFSHVVKNILYKVVTLYLGIIIRRDPGTN
jgi:hypothetical protein